MTNKKKIAALLFTTTILVIVIALLCRKDKYQVKLCKSFKETLKRGDSIIAINSTTDFLWDSLYIIWGWHDEKSIYQVYNIHLSPIKLDDDFLLYVFFYKGKEAFVEKVYHGDGCSFSFPKMTGILSGSIYKISSTEENTYILEKTQPSSR